MGVLLKEKYSEGAVKNDWCRGITYQIVEQVGPHD